MYLQSYQADADLKKWAAADLLYGPADFIAVYDDQGCDLKDRSHSDHSESSLNTDGKNHQNKMSNGSTICKV
jgi:hypothetical protein